MKIACLTMAVFLALFTYWQFNDLEQYGTALWPGWVITYGGACLLSLFSAFRPLPRALYGGLSAAAFVAAVIRVQDIEWDKTVLYNESNPSGNESGGLLILGIWFLVLALKLKPVAARPQSN
jgi:hypothetical protein